MASKRTAALEAMIEEATVDAYNDDEQLTGLYTMIEDNLAVPFTTTVLGIKVTVRKVDLTRRCRQSRPHWSGPFSYAGWILLISTSSGLSHS